MAHAHDAETQRCRAARIPATILNSGQTLLALLNDMLDFPKVEAGKIELTQAVFDPRQIVAETVAIFRELAQAKGLVIESDLHVPANRSYRADPIRLRQMLSNLISNAIKFTSRGSVRVEVTEVDGTENHALLEFAVTDSGIGIPPDKHVVLFKPFSQADSSTTRDYGGTGLGLSIVRNLALLMGGDAGLKPAGTGLAFLVPHSSRYPASRRRESPVPAPPGIGKPTGAATGLAGYVLVVEDNLINRKVIETMLMKLNVEVDSVENGQEAVAAIMRGCGLTWC